MFGYATDETDECMPLTVVLSHALNKKIADLRRDGTLWWARPDSKTQVIIQYTVFFQGYSVLPYSFSQNYRIFFDYSDERNLILFNSSVSLGSLLKVACFA